MRDTQAVSTSVRRISKERVDPTEMEIASSLKDDCRCAAGPERKYLRTTKRNTAVKECDWGQPNGFVDFRSRFSLTGNTNLIKSALVASSDPATAKIPETLLKYVLYNTPYLGI